MTRNVFLTVFLFICVPCLYADAAAYDQAVSSGELIAEGPLPDYDALAKACQKKSSINCCLSSVEAMQAGPFMLDEGKTFEDSTCPAGYNPNMLRCTDSYRWCVPKEKVKKVKKKVKKKAKKKKKWFWQEEEPCPLIAMVCPDGTTVGPSYPGCEFRCPE